MIKVKLKNTYMSLYGAYSYMMIIVRKEDWKL